MTGRSSVLSRRTFFASAAACGALAGFGMARPVLAAGTIKPGPASALIVVDVQNCFVDGGTLPARAERRSYR